MSATDNNTALTYKELQAKLKEFKAQGHTLTCKLNANKDTLQAEFNRLTATLESDLQELFAEVDSIMEQDIYATVLDQVNTTALLEEWEYLATPEEEEEPWEWGTTTKAESSYPFNSYQGQQVKAVISVPEPEAVEAYTTNTHFAMAKDLVPSWLAKEHEVYLIDSVEYFSWELEVWLEQNAGECCTIALPPQPDLTALEPTAVEEIVEAVEAVTSLVEPEATVPVQRPVAPQPVTAKCNGRWSKYLANQVTASFQAYLGDADPTVQQAWSNGKLITKCAFAFGRGFLEGLKQGKRNVVKEWAASK